MAVEDLIDDGYWDVGGTWHPTPDSTRAAILAAIGEEDPVAVDAVAVVRQGESRPWSRRGELRLEDGSTRRLDGQLPGDLPLGYHDFHDDDGRSARVIVTPRQCLKPERPVWGWAVQLYAARSRRSWGMGDLADLRMLGAWSADLGAGLMLVNPLTAVAPLVPPEPSPYYPTSRRFFNPLYIAVEEVPGADRLGDELERFAGMGRALNQGRLIDRSAIFRLKYEALRRIWEHQPPTTGFQEFCGQGGRSLDEYAAFSILAREHGGDWRAWPVEYRDPSSGAVTSLMNERRNEVDFEKWLQWLIDRQLEQAKGALPLVLDLPIGVDPGGLDSWVWQDTLAQGCTVGAPPDPFQEEGQNWSLPPFIPHRLRAAGYEPLIQSVRASLKHSAGLRIDHVMGLFRLFWIPKGKSAVEGTYVRYPAEEMLGILALESHRAGAFVVGEDLGTVEPEVREKLREYSMLSFRLLYFEDVPPKEYPPLAMATVTTHDLPTLAGTWSTDPPEAVDGFQPPGNGSNPEMRRRLQQRVGISDHASAVEAIEATYRKLAEAPSLVLLATLDDAAAVRQQPNLPGTTHEWPNWSMALPGGLEALAESDLPRRIAWALRRS
ncbi:MAG: 4-alpha-glucanotransferase [Planctomycetota bacterium]